MGKGAVFAAPRQQPVRRPRPARPGVRALEEIRRLQRSTDLILPKRPFRRVMKDVMRTVDTDGAESMRLTSTAVEALQEAAEAFLVSVFSKAQLAAIHAKRVTLMPKDIHLIQKVAE